MSETIPTAARYQENCPWCWRNRHQGKIPFPKKVSSSICPYHLFWMQRQAADRKARRSLALSPLQNELLAD